MPKKKGSSTKNSPPPAKASDVMKVLRANKFAFSAEVIASKTIDVDGTKKKLSSGLTKELSELFADEKHLVEKIKAAFAPIKFATKNTNTPEDYKKEPRKIRTSPAGTLTIPVATYFGKTRHPNEDKTANVFDKFDCRVTYNNDGSITVMALKPEK